MKTGIYYLDNNEGTNPNRPLLMGGMACLGMYEYEDYTVKTSPHTLNPVTQIFIKEYENEVEKVKRKGTMKQKLAYLIARMKNKESISKQVNNMIKELLK